MSGDYKKETFPVLYKEHLALEANFDERGIVASYGTGNSVGNSTVSGSLETGRLPSDDTCLADLSHALTLLFSGSVASSFAQAGFAGKTLEIGECAFQAVLTGDGSIASIPLLVRTGTSEYVSFDASRRADILEAWLSFLSGISQNDYRPYDGLETEDVTGSHVILMLWGKKALKVISDYAPEDQLPTSGHVASVSLDKIRCIVVCLPLSEPAYLVLVPPHLAAVLWRSLLSFTEVTPVGDMRVREFLVTQKPWFSLLDATDTVRMDSSELTSYNLVRNEANFVGARGLTTTRKGD